MSEADLQRHVGRHLENIALFVLPHVASGEFNEESGEDGNLDQASQLSALSSDHIWAVEGLPQLPEGLSLHGETSEPGRQVFIGCVSLIVTSFGTS